MNIHLPEHRNNVYNNSADAGSLGELHLRIDWYGYRGDEIAKFSYLLSGS